MRADRLNEMEQLIVDKGNVSLEHLASHFQISLNTVRRDLGELLLRGNIKKVYGGVSANTYIEPQPFSVRSQKNCDAKKTIGEIAAGLVKNDSTVFIDSGSTTVCSIPFLAQKRNITLVTHSLIALYEASKYPQLNVISLGGLYYPMTSSYVGANTLSTLSMMSMDYVFLAATGVSLDRGLAKTTYFEAELNRNVSSRNRNLILMADSSKFDHHALITFCDFSLLHAVISEKMLPAHYLSHMEQAGIRFYCPETLS